MISLLEFERPAMSDFAKALFMSHAEAQRTSLLLDYAEFCGLQDDGKGGRIELWTLRKAITGHPKGSTVARETIEAYLFPESKTP